MKNHPLRLGVFHKLLSREWKGLHASLRHGLVFFEVTFSEKKKTKTCLYNKVFMDMLYGLVLVSYLGVRNIRDTHLPKGGGVVLRHERGRRGRVFALNFTITIHNNWKTREAFNKPFDFIMMCFMQTYFVKKSHSYLICIKGVN